MKLNGISKLNGENDYAILVDYGIEGLSVRGCAATLQDAIEDVMSFPSEMGEGVSIVKVCRLNLKEVCEATE